MERGLVAMIMLVAIILFNMIVGPRCDGYESEPQNLAQVAIGRRYFAAENGEINEFKWNAQCNVLRSSADPSRTR